jgi:hypothetical protein
LLLPTSGKMESRAMLLWEDTVGSLNIFVLAAHADPGGLIHASLQGAEMGFMQALRKNAVRGSGDNADSSSSSGDSDGEAGPVKGQKPRRRRWLLWGGLAALLVAIIIAIIVGVALSKRGPPYACDAHVRIRPGSETGKDLYNFF